MVEGERQAFSSLVTRFALNWRQEASFALRENLWLGLSDLPFELVQAAMDRAMRAEEYLPPLAALRSYARPKTTSHQWPEPEAANGQPKYWEPTVAPVGNAEMVEICLGNAQKAADEERIARARYRAMRPGAVGLGDERSAIIRTHSDQAHWREYAEYYRQRGEREGHATIVPVPTGMTRPPAQGSGPGVPAPDHGAPAATGQKPAPISDNDEWVNF